ALSLWPYLNAFCKAGRMPRIASLFEPLEAAEGRPEHSWLQDSTKLTLFSERQRCALPKEWTGKSEILPLEFGLNLDPGADLLIPAAVSEWRNPEDHLRKLRELLVREPSRLARILGGWGTWKDSRRRAGWRILSGVDDRVSLHEPLAFEHLR